MDDCVIIIENYLRLALAGLESHLGRVHVDLLESMEGLGNVLYVNKRLHVGVLEECDALFHRALTLREQCYGKSDKGTACGWLWLGIVCMFMNLSHTICMCLYMYVFVCVCLYVCVCICMCLYMYVYIRNTECN